MFYETDPLDTLQGNFVAALLNRDAALMRAIADQDPRVVHPMPGYASSPFQRLAMEMHSHMDMGSRLACMDVLMDHGADPLERSGHGSPPLSLILSRGLVKVVQHMHDRNNLAKFLYKGVEGNGVLHFIFTSTQWKNLGSSYPVAELARILLDAGADPVKGLYTDKSPLDHLLWSSMPQYGYPRPSTLEDACLLMLERDTSTLITPTHLLQAFRSDFKRAFSVLVPRYQAAGGTFEDMDDKTSKMKPEDKSEFSACFIAAQNSLLTDPSAADPKRPRL